MFLIPSFANPVFMHTRKSIVRQASNRTVVELLEQRRLLSSTVFVVAPTANQPGQISIVGGQGADKLTLSVKNVGAESLLVLNDHPKDTIIGRQPLSATPFKNFNILMSGGHGNDTLANATNISITIDGGTGDDVVTGGAAGDTFFWNGLDREKFVGTGGLNVVQLSYPAVGKLTYDAANVVISDKAITSSITEIVTEPKIKQGKAQTGTADLTKVGKVVVTGTPSSDTITADNYTGIAQLFGAAGNDNLRGGKGNDLLVGGAGKDSTAGNAGDDVIVADYADFAGALASTQIGGGTGIDTLWMDGQGPSTPASAAGAIYNNADFEVVNGGNGDDKIDSSGMSVGVKLLGNGGNDTLIGGSSNDDLQGGDAIDLLTGNAGKDAMAGGTGNDTIVAQYPDFVGGAAITGGTGSDVLWMDGQTPSTPPTAPGSATYVNTDIETVNGGNGNDKIDSSTMTVGIALNGNGGNDTLIGGKANDVLDGGAGSDSLQGNAGNDSLEGGAGDDSLYGNAGADLLTDTGGGTTTSDKTAEDQLIILSTGPLTDAQLGTTGDMMALLQSGAINIVGASTGGFKLIGDWVSQIDASGNEVFKATSAVVKLRTYFGDVAIPNVAAFPISVVTKPDAFSGSGVFSSFTLGGSSGIQLGLNDSSSPMGKLAGQFGITGTLPSLSFGIDAGSNLTRLGFPLAKGLPYFFAEASLGGSLSFGGATASFSAFNSAMAFDPTDPSFFAMLPNPFGPVGVLDNLKIGGSLHGYIPFTPKLMPKIFSDTGNLRTGDVLGYGNLYVTGRIRVADILRTPPVPVFLSGELFLGVDSSRNLPSTEKIITGTNLKAIVTSSEGFVGEMSNLFEKTTANDLFVGVNGRVELGVKKLGFEFTMPLGNASLAHKRINGVSTVGVRGEFTTNPFKDTILEGVIAPPIDLAVAVDAGFNANNDFTLGFGYDKTTPFGGGTLDKRYAFTLTNSSFTASASVGFRFDPLDIEVASVTAKGSVSGTMTLSLINSVLYVTGRAAVTGGLVFTAAGESWEVELVDIGLDFNNNGFTLDLDYFPTINVTW